MLEKFPELQSTDVLLKAQNLIIHVQSSGVNINKDDKDLFDFVNQLAAAMSVRISEYLMEDAVLLQTTVCNGPEGFLKRGARSNHVATFGEELDEHLRKTNKTVPMIVTKCIEALEKDGILMKGIYRVSAVKSHVERLCKQFEYSGGESIDLSAIHPNIIANVLKSYFRQLPRPLFTFELYEDFIRFSEKYPTGSAMMLSKSARNELKQLIEKIPPNYYLTLKTLMHHLKKVSSADNNMSASNLGIVFGPTLLNSNSDHSFIISLTATMHQSRIVELVIGLADEIFINEQK